MGAVAASRRKAKASVVPRPSEFREALERALELSESDEHIGPALCATELRMRFEFTGSDLALNVWAGRNRRLRWSFGAVDWEPRLVLAMSATVANRYLQGRESLAIAIARRQVKVRGDSRAALRYLPATRMLCEPYRRVIETEFPALAA